jgi:hypothetical protein
LGACPVDTGGASLWTITGAVMHLKGSSDVLSLTGIHSGALPIGNLCNSMAPYDLLQLKQEPLSGFVYTRKPPKSTCVSSLHLGISTRKKH